jgi:hypothetical protein
MEKSLHLRLELKFGKKAIYWLLLCVFMAFGQPAPIVPKPPADHAVQVDFETVSKSSLRMSGRPGSPMS